MDKQQTLSIIQLTMTYYPNLKIDNLKATLEAWHFILAEYDLEPVLANLKAYVKAGERFPPGVGQLLPQKGEAIPTITETQKLLLEMNAPKKLPTAEELQSIFAKMDKMLDVKG